MYVYRYVCIIYRYLQILYIYMYVYVCIIYRYALLLRPRSRDWQQAQDARDHGHCQVFGQGIW